MSATFSPSLATARDRLRMRLGDVDTEHALLADETYDGAISQYGENGAAAFLAAALVAEYGQYPTRTDENGVTLDFTDRLRAWQWVVEQANSAPVYASGGVQSASVTLTRRDGWDSRADEYGRPVRW